MRMLLESKSHQFKGELRRDLFLNGGGFLRCSHCFVGEDLNRKLDFEFSLFEKLLKTAKSWNTKEITFLGGEPTLYPRIVEAVNLSIKSNKLTLK